MALSTSLTYADGAEKKETKQVCVDQMKDGKPVKDAKGNTKQTCKDVKQHRKLEVADAPGKK